MKRGVFVTFEGIESCGKTTQLAILAVRIMEKYGCKVLLLREPGGTEVGEGVRTLFKAGSTMTGLTEVLLISASRAELVATRIQPSLDRGEVVLCDRFYDSTLAYQGYGRGISLETIRNITGYVTGNITVPDLTFFLKVLPVVSRNRTKQRGGLDRIEKEPDEFFNRVANGFEQLALQNPTRFITIDGAPEEVVVASTIWAEFVKFVDSEGVE